MPGGRRPRITPLGRPPLPVEPRHRLLLLLALADRERPARWRGRTTALSRRDASHRSRVRQRTRGYDLGCDSSIATRPPPDRCRSPCDTTRGRCTTPRDGWPGGRWRWLRPRRELVRRALAGLLGLGGLWRMIAEESLLEDDLRPRGGDAESCLVVESGHIAAPSTRQGVKKRLEALGSAREIGVRRGHSESRRRPVRVDSAQRGAGAIHDQAAPSRLLRVPLALSRALPHARRHTARETSHVSRGHRVSRPGAACRRRHETPASRGGAREGGPPGSGPPPGLRPPTPPAHDHSTSRATEIGLATSSPATASAGHGGGGGQGGRRGGPPCMRNRVFLPSSLDRLDDQRLDMRNGSVRTTACAPPFEVWEASRRWDSPVERRRR